MTPENASPAPRAPYQVLARKYRPTRFDDLIGHEAMVRTLRNAFDAGRIAHAYLLTGVRGVGKTTTARILARALNYKSLEDAAAGVDRGPQIDMPAPGVHCAAIAESRHPDVLEMDAASRTGVNDVRELIEGVRYAPVEARYKVYIIDEVHMLSTAAFNALLKTLEEPPAHVKFVFATTEIRKLPVTVLSRCQRFDLRRVTPETLAAHLAAIAQREEAAIEAEALAMIARAAEGSVRDALSLLDQAIVQRRGGASVTAEDARAMLGLADRTETWALLEATLEGEAGAALAAFRRQFDAGADPQTVLRDLLELVHLLTRTAAAGPDAAAHGGAGEADAGRAAALAREYPVNALTRAWSLLLKGLAETAAAPDPAAAAEMTLIRLAFAASLPTPDEALRALKGAGGAPREGRPSGPKAADAPTAGGSAPGGSAADAQAPETPAVQAPKLRLRRFDDVARVAGERRDAALRAELESYVHVVAFQEGRIEMRLDDRAPADLPGRLMRTLKEWTGDHWAVTVSAGAEGAPTLREARLAEVMTHPEILKVLEMFPDAKVVSIRDLELTADPGEDDRPGADARNASDG